MFQTHVHADVNADAHRSASAMNVRKQTVLFLRLDLLKWTFLLLTEITQTVPTVPKIKTRV